MIEFKDMSIGQLRAGMKSCWAEFEGNPTVDNYMRYSAYKKALISKGVVVDYVSAQEKSMY